MGDLTLVAELDRRFHQRDGWLLPALVTLLVERGHLDAVRHQAAAGDWHCLRALADLRVAAGDVDGAVELLRPVAGTGWWVAVEALAGVLAGHDRAGEAVALVRPFAEAGDRPALELLVTLLAGQGLIDEVVALLRPHPVLSGMLVRLTDGHGRDDEVAAVLTAALEDAPDRGFVLTCLATVLDRQGRFDQAYSVLRGNLGHGTFRPLAELLGRHGRGELLRELAATGDGRYAAERLAELREREGHVESAIEALRPFVDGGRRNAKPALAALLDRHGRTEEAVALLRTMTRKPPPGNERWLADTLGTLLLRLGRPEEALAAIDEIAASQCGMWFELLQSRTRLLVADGRTDQAIDEVHAHPEGSAAHGVALLAELLAGAGRLDEAVEALWPYRVTRRHDLAMLLVRQGRVDLAITVATSPADSHDAGESVMPVPAS
ncbi:hypothetical protein ACFO1B_14020 [Dactylosporangium siamense]|uniref:Tetratricopeptide repeat protein n=1 Tax=Dactylosporangium siamense TaxID=685454 RepID=A0A919UF72_9ACTN|nr:hypothetical protein [Dactylosporangium siamense]GIG49841.1 hypothetical protein Dsi01nite_078820 [Dactylosporangium siamense]